MICQLILITALRPHDAYPVYCPCTLREHHQPGKYLITKILFLFGELSIDIKGYVNLLMKDFIYTKLYLVLQRGKGYIRVEHKQFSKSLNLCVA